MHARIFRQLGVERRDEYPALACEHGLALELREDLDALAGLAHAGRADEYATQRLVLTRQPEVRLEARDLATVGVSVDDEVDEAEMVTVEDDHPGARSENWTLELANRLVEAVEPHQAHERGGLATRDDQAVEAGKLLGLSDLHCVRTEPAKHCRVLAKVALDCKYSDSH